MACAVVGLGVVSLGGCAALRDLFARGFQKPTLVFKTLSLRDMSLGGGTVDLVYTLHNPNPLGLSLAEVDYAFSVEGKPVVAGRPPNGFRVAANSNTDVTFPATVHFQDIAPVVQVFLTKDQARYRAEGHLGIQTPLGIIKIPLSKEGTFEVPKLPTVRLESPRVKSLSFSGATVEFPLVVTNRNTYALPIRGLTGALQIAGASVGTLSTGELGSFAGKAQRNITLPLTVNFAQAAQAGAALRGGSANVDFDGQLRSGGVAIPVKFSQQLQFQRP